MATSPVFQSTGIASGIDWGTMIDKLVTLESQPITDLQQKQSAYQTQVSQIGDIASKISALQTAAASLASSGVLSVKASSSNVAFSATPGAGAAAGSYAIEVKNLATSAKALSNAYSSSDATVAGATLTLTVQGKTSNPITLADGSSLADVAGSINGAGLGVTATVLNDGTNSYLSLANTATGYPLTGTADDALKVNVQTTGTNGTALSLTTTQAAQNAAFTVDGLSFARTSNTVTDAIPGTTVTLKSKSASGAETLELDNDETGTATNLNNFITAYNNLMTVVQGDLNVNDKTDRSTTLAGDSTVRSLGSDLQSLIIADVPGGSLQRLADLGVGTKEDGTLTLDESVLSSAIAKDPNAVNRIFSDRTTGIGALTKNLSDNYTNSVSGLLTTRSKSLTDSISDINNRIADEQQRVDTYKANLTAQYTAMEQTISQWKSVGQYLTSQSSSSSA